MPFTLFRSGRGPAAPRERGARRAAALAGALAACALAALADEPEVAPEARKVLEGQPPSLVQELFEHKAAIASHADQPAQQALGFVIFDQPVERVYRLLTQTARQREYRPEIAHIETVEQLPDGTVDEQRLRILFLDIRYRLRNLWDPARRRITWQLDPRFDNDLQRIEGYWQIYPLDERRSLGVLATSVTLAPGMPAFLEDYATRKNLPGTLERCRRWVNSDGGKSD